MKLITFTVPCYNSQNEMRRCIDSLLTAGKRAEIIIIDDGSTDDTGAIADAYANEYPNIVRVIHQENGGHGEGINQGILHARGKYFKVVDSDDWLDPEALKKVVQKLRRLESEGGVDMVVANYVYTNADKSVRKRTVRYRNIFPAGKVVTWDKTRPFLVYQLLTLHSCIFRTKVVRDSGIVLPKHMSYEDNLFIYAQMPYVKNMCYMNQDLYRYYIGRDGQSVSAEIMAKKWKQQMYISEEIFCMYDIGEIKRTNAKLAKYMYHESLFMFLITTVFARMNDTEESDTELRAMWRRMKAHDYYMALRMRYASYVTIVSMPGKAGRRFTRIGYLLANRAVRFNG